jgi:hypothetical protein
VEVVPHNSRFRVFPKSFSVIVAFERNGNEVQRNCGEVKRRVAPTGIAPIDEGQQPAFSVAHNVPLVQVIVNETVRAATTSRNKRAEIGEQSFDFANHGPTSVTAVGESLENQLESQFAPRRIQVSIGIWTRPHPVVQSCDLLANIAPDVLSRVARKIRQAERFPMDPFPQ